MTLFRTVLVSSGLVLAFFSGAAQAQQNAGAGARHLGRVAMRSNQRSTVMPALVAGIHVFLARSSASKAWMAGTSPAKTPKK